MGDALDLCPNAVWTVVVRAKAAGDKRFGVTLRTKDTEREIIETEATRFYE